MSSKPFSAWWIGSYNVSNIVGASVPTDVQFYDLNNVESIISSMVTGTNDDIQPDRARSGIIENNRPRADGSFDLGIMNSGGCFPFVFDKADEYPYYCADPVWSTCMVT